ncbi:dTDP-4-dehydrorhamnose reductase [Nocardia camponoti]|uniref:dTDP-4-dehydrorhamnose reductase n=1 Tax=Nocardia camponoti TaxID=1616106 RepID=UPI00227BFAFD|nr:dTDP-4-dehydrorhamnose reductase [Nocardia camponoti]
MNTDFAPKTRLLVTGAGGLLGREIMRLAPHAVALTRADLDITDRGAVDALVRPGDVVLNCAAYTAVDAAESDVDNAFAGNTTGPAVLAAATAHVGARLIHVSTDYVFAGDADTPYEPADPVAPATVYGRSKLAGEEAVRAAAPNAQIVRTAWVYSGVNGDFVATMRKLERERDTISVVADQHGSPTSAADLAAALIELTTRPDAPSTLHTTNAGTATWYDLAVAVFEELGADPTRVQPCDSSAFPRPAPRPAYSVLAPTVWNAAGLTPLRHWRSALTDALSAATR